MLPLHHAEALHPWRWGCKRVGKRVRDGTLGITGIAVGSDSGREA